MSDGNQNLGDPQCGRTPGCIAAHVHSRLASTGDLYVLPSDTTPASAQRFHYRLFAGKPGSKTALRFGESKGVLSLMDGETPFCELRILIQQAPHTLNIRQVDA